MKNTNTQTTDPIRIVLVEDHAVVKIGLRTILTQNPRMDVIDEVGTIADAHTAIPRLKPDVVLMDVRLPDGNGVEACQEILATTPETHVLFLTSFEDEDARLQAILAGAAGYLLKKIAPDELIQAIELVVAGHSIHTHKAIRIVLVEDHAVVKIGLRTILTQNPRMDVIDEVGTIADAHTAIPRLKPDVVLMDVRLPDGNGVEACQEILATTPETHVLFLTSFEDEDARLQAILAGAAGYLLKKIAPDELIQAIELVVAGHSIHTHKAIRSVQTWSQTTQSQRESGDNWGLSPQQYRIFALVGEGKTNKEIAQCLDLSDKTVRNYLVKIFDKLRITRRTQAAALFGRQALQNRDI